MWMRSTGLRGEKAWSRGLAACAWISAFLLAGSGLSLAGQRKQGSRDWEKVISDMLERQSRTTGGATSRRSSSSRRSSVKKADLSALKASLERAEDAFANENYAEAAACFQDVAAAAGVPGAVTLVSRARKKLAEMEDMARETFNRAGVKQRIGDFESAVDLYNEVLVRFPYSETAADTRNKLRILAANPDCMGALALAEARAQEEAENYAKALHLYDDIAVEWPDNISGLHAAAAAARLRANEEIMEIVAEQMRKEADRVCPGKIRLAENYRMNGDLKRARTVLDELIQSYPESRHARAASSMLADMERKGK